MSEDSTVSYSSILVICQLHCQHNLQVQKELWDETREPESLTSISGKITVLIKAKMDKRSLVKVSKTSVNDRVEWTDSINSISYCHHLKYRAGWVNHHNAACKISSFT